MSVLPKSFDPELLFRNTAVAQAWIDDKVERESAYVVVKAMWAQAADLFEHGYALSAVPISLNVWPSTNPKFKRFIGPDGAVRMGVGEDDEGVRIIPLELEGLEAFKKSMFIVVHVVDRAPTTIAAFNFLLPN